MSVFHRIDVTEVWRASEKTLTGLDKMQPRSHEEHEHEAHETHKTTKYTKNTKQNSHRPRKNTRALGGVRRTPRRGGHRPARQADQPNTVRAMLCGLCACRAKLASPRRAKAGALRSNGVLCGRRGKN